jgi:hypothetical protein
MDGQKPRAHDYQCYIEYLQKQIELFDIAIALLSDIETPRNEQEES